MAYGSAMDWELLFEDLHSQLDAAERGRVTEEAAELAEAESGQVRLTDRLRARAGQDVALRLRDGTELHGRLADVAPQWLLLADGRAHTLVPTAAVAVAWPLGLAAPAAGTVESRLRITHALRAIGRQGADVLVVTTAGPVAGRLVRVGHDHVDVRAQGGRTRTVALSAVLAVRSA